MRNVAFTPKGDHIAWTQVPTDSINTICVPVHGPHHNSRGNPAASKEGWPDGKESDCFPESVILYHESSMAEVETTAEQFTERLDRMLSMPDTSLITSQGTPRPPWPKMLSGLWLLPSTVYLPNWRKRDEA
ncbi:hypothetical protein RRG08_030634 [Elysia crispata]|uniref:Uncharacterized protein n=1 Tax=Elysia crispata TaxID=231223 RepID=A0AAE1D3F0_9GAST|nr:hypothetical protein RRG08_030634 [Elysia crispata]